MSKRAASRLSMTLSGAPPPKPRIGTMKSMQSQAERSNETREISPAGKLVFHRLCRCNLLVPIIEPRAARSRVIHVRTHTNPRSSFVARTYFALPHPSTRATLRPPPGRDGTRLAVMAGTEPAQCEE